MKILLNDNRTVREAFRNYCLENLQELQYFLQFVDKILFVKDPESPHPLTLKPITGDLQLLLGEQFGYLVIIGESYNDLDHHGHGRAIYETILRIPRSFDGSVEPWDVQTMRLAVHKYTMRRHSEQFS